MSLNVVALENEHIERQAEIIPDEDYVDAHIDLTAATESIAYGMAQLERVNRLRLHLNRIGKANFGTEEYRMAQIAERIISREVKRSLPASVSTESISPGEYYHIAQEGVGDLFNHIWEAIKRAYNWIVEKIVSVFKGKKVQTVITKSRNEKVKKEVAKVALTAKENVVAAKHEVTPEEKREVIKDDRILEPLRYLGTKITLKDLANCMADYDRGMKQYNDLVSAATKAVGLINGFFETMIADFQEHEAGNESNIGDANGNLKKLIDYIQTTLGAAIEALPQTKNFPEHVLKQHQMKLTDFDHSNMRYIGTFVNGAYLHFAKQNSNPLRSYSMYVVTNNTATNEQGKSPDFPYMSISNLEEFSAISSRLVDKNLDYERQWIIALEQIVTMSKTIINACDTIVHSLRKTDRNDVNEAQAATVFESIKAASNFLIDFNKMSVETMLLFTKTQIVMHAISVAHTDFYQGKKE